MKTKHSQSTHATKPDPKYPFKNELNDQGQTVYWVPVEMPEDRTADIPVSKESGCTLLYFRAGKPMRVRFIQTTDRTIAYSQKAWLSTLHTQERRQAERYELLEGTTKVVDGEPVSREENPLLQTWDDGFIKVEHEDLPGLVAKMIDEKHPDNPLYRKVYLLCVEEIEPKVIAERLRIDQQMVYFYRKEAYKVAQEYKRKYLPD